MTRNGIILTAIGGAAAAALLTNYLRSEQGKQKLNQATTYLKDVAGKAQQYAKNNVPGLKEKLETADTVQPS